MSFTFSIATLNITCSLRSHGIDFVLVGECYLTKHYNYNNYNNISYNNNDNCPVLIESLSNARMATSSICDIKIEVQLFN